MPSFPIPVFVAVVLAFLLLRHRLAGGRFGPLGWLIALCALQSVIIALAQHYDVAAMGRLQPVTAIAIPPLAWLAFTWTAIRPKRPSDARHIIGPLCAALALLVWPPLLDALIPGLFIGYGVALLLKCRGGADSLPQLRLEGGHVPGLIWRVIAISLILSAVSDLLIVAARLSGFGWLQPVLVSVFSAATLLLVGLLSLRPELESEAVEPVAAKAVPVEGIEDREVMNQLADLMARDRPYLDPDLTLTRLARRVGIPARTVSGAINRTTGQNVSRYMNDARIAAAQERLREGDTVTVAMLSSGYNTKSNFNREFLRVAGMTPTEWLESRKPGGA